MSWPRSATYTEEIAAAAVAARDAFARGGTPLDEALHLYLAARVHTLDPIASTSSRSIGTPPLPEPHPAPRAAAAKPLQLCQHRCTNLERLMGAPLPRPATLAARLEIPFEEWP